MSANLAVINPSTALTVVRPATTALATVAPTTTALTTVTQNSNQALETIGQAISKPGNAKTKIVALAVAGLAALGLIAKTASDNKEAKENAKLYASA